MVNWIAVEEHEPPVNTFMPLWFWDGEKVHMGHYQGLGAWMTGEVHGKVTHWAHIVRPEPPGAQP